MRKPEIEIVKFDSSDVIATSGQSYSLMVSKYKDGQKGNLTVNFNGGNYTSLGSLKSALGSVGLDIYNDTVFTDTPASTKYGGGKDFKTYFEYDADYDGTGEQYHFNDNVNGTYTWFDTDNKWHKA